ncbi:MAG: MarR family transcriptional regulator, partial [Nocardiopsaceae bacterium]|nr:MarR family transcriptional regulator [Nocardiopsaceae bacterium]
RREPHPHDGRMIRLRLTDRGRSLERDIDAEIARVTDRALDGLSPDDRRALIRALGAIHRNLSSG